AGTALYLMDQYLNPRSLSTPAVLFAIVCQWENRLVRAASWLAVAGLIHPQMAVFGFCYILLLVWMSRPRRAGVASVLLLPFGLSFGPPSDAYRATLQWKTYFFLRYWQWYEWLGILGPLLSLWWIVRFARRRDLSVLELLSRSLI